jgi:hypothetical protein
MKMSRVSSVQYLGTRTGGARLKASGTGTSSRNLPVFIIQSQVSHDAPQYILPKTAYQGEFFNAVISLGIGIELGPFLWYQNH